MELLVRVRDEQRTVQLMDLLRSLDFVESVSVSDIEEQRKGEAEVDFFALAGLWEGRGITIETIRQQAWPRYNHDSL